MDQSKTLKRFYVYFIYNLKSLGSMFFIPVAVYALTFIYLYFSYFRHPIPMDEKIFKSVVGIVPIICVCFWAISLFGDFVEDQNKECLLCLPYTEFKFGILRILIMSLLYIMFFITFVLVCIFIKDIHIPLESLSLPVIAIIFYTSLSFFSLLLTKSILGAYIFVGVFTCFSYITRGGTTGWIYPFHWVNPKPGANTMTINITLVVSSMILLALGHYLFKRREYLIK